jgi:hypothetical protein
MDNKQVPNKAAVEKASIVGEELYNKLVLEAPVSKLPERIFQQTFLPYFTGKKKMEENPDIIKTWVAIAGNPGAAVDIIDNNSDDVLFRVPPLYNTDFVQSSINTRIPYEGIIHEFEERSASSPKMAERFLKNVLDKTKNMLVTNNNHVEEYREMWNKIFDHYGINEESPKKDNNAISDDELIID